MFASQFLRGLVLAALSAAPMLGTSAAAGTTPFIGEIMPTANNFCPRGTMETNGQILPIADYTALYSLLGTLYGGDGVTSFALPDLRGRVAVHAGAGPGLTPVRQGERYGSETHTLVIPEMPAHNHTASSTASSSLHATTAIGTQQSPDGAQLAELPQGRAFATGATLDSTMDPGSVTTTVETTIQNTGGGVPFSLLQPSLVIRFCIAIEGIYPSRN